jgi:hypothetical protein
LQAAVDTLKVQRQLTADAEKHKSEISSKLTEELCRENAVALEAADSRATKAELECNELASRLVRAEEEVQAWQSKLSAAVRENEDTAQLLDSLRFKMISYEERLRVSIPAAEASAHLQRERVDMCAQISSWQEKHTKATETIHMLRTQGVEDFIKLRHGLEMLTSTSNSRDMCVPFVDAHTGNASIVRELCRVIANVRQMCARAVDSIALPRASNLITDDTTSESTHRLLAEARLVFSAARSSHQDARLGIEREKETHSVANSSNGKQVGREAEVGKGVQALLESLVANLQVVHQYELERNERVSSSVQERDVAHREELQELRQRLAWQERTSRENLETLAASESIKLDANKQAIMAEAHRLTASYEDAVKASAAELQCANDKLYENEKSLEAVRETAQKQQLEIDMLRADVCRAVELHTAVQDRLAECEQCYNEALSSLERTQLKASQEARKRHDLERTVRRLNVGSYESAVKSL